MTIFRMLLIALWISLLIYTGSVIAAHGMDLMPIFFGDIAKGAWPGQFNLDFLCMLILSALWTAWRNGFSAVGLLLGVAAFLGGAGFLLAYLLFLSFQSGGNVKAMLLGKNA